MSEVNYADFYKEALAAAGQGAKVLPDGEGYELKIAGKNVKPAAGTRKLQVGVRLEVMSGAFAGESTWVNQTFSPENSKAVAAYLATMRQLGGDEEVSAAMAAGQSPEQLAAYITVGTLGTGDLTSTEGNKPNEDGTPKKFQNVKNFKITGFIQPASTPTTPGGVIPGSIPSPGPLPTPTMPAMQVQLNPQQAAGQLNTAPPIQQPPAITQPVAMPEATPMQPGEASQLTPRF